MCTQNRNNCNCGCVECTSSNVVCYTGPTLPNSGITNNDTLTVSLQKLDNVFTNNTKYKVYTGLLNQSGISSLGTIFTGSLTIGVTYQILDDGGAVGYDFTNVGAPNNNDLTYFVATGTTPTSWGTNVYLQYDTGAPTVTVLENTIGNIWFTYNGTGNYLISTNGLFTPNKTIYFVTNTNGADITLIFLTPSGFPYNMVINSTDITGAYTDGLLISVPIEIRVYN